MHEKQCVYHSNVNKISRFPTRFEYNAATRVYRAHRYTRCNTNASQATAISIKAAIDTPQNQATRTRLPHTSSTCQLGTAWRCMLAMSRDPQLVCGSHRTPKMNSIPRCLPGLSHGLRGHTARSHKMAPMLQQLPAGHVGRTRSLHLLHSWRWLGTHTRALQWPLIQTT